MIRSLIVFILTAAAVWAQTQGSAAAPTQPSAPAQTQSPTPTPAPAQPVPPQSSTSPNPQTAPKPPATLPAQPESASKVVSTDPVITVHGVCNTAPKRTAGTATRKTASAQASATGPCQTVMTKAQFERLLETVNPNFPAGMRRNLAQQYVELLAFAQAAQKAGVENDPKFTEQLRLLRMQALANIYRRNLDEKYRNPAPAEIDGYYKEHLPKYEEIKLSRIFIPAKNPSSPNKDDWEKKAAQAANDLHDRAAKGEDFEKLQKEAYTTLGLTIAPPNTTVGTRRRGMLAPAEEQELFALKPGEVSKLEQEPAGYIIYKVESKQTLPVDQAKDEISRELYRQKMESQMKSISGSVKADFNDQYFGTPVPPPSAATPGIQPPSAPAPKPPAPAPATPPASAAPPASTPPQGQASPK